MKNIRYKLFLSIEKETPDDWIHIRSLLNAKEYVLYIGCPQEILVDSDMAMEFARYIVKVDTESQLKFIPQEFKFEVSGENTTAKEYLDQYLNLRGY